jgi:hypothetical protein
MLKHLEKIKLDERLKYPINQIFKWI